MKLSEINTIQIALYNGVRFLHTSKTSFLDIRTNKTLSVDDVSFLIIEDIKRRIKSGQCK